MKAGLWQILIFTGLIVFFFWPLVVKVLRFVAANRNNPDGKEKITRKDASRFRCPKCGEELAAKARFCSRCGYDVSAIDV